MAVNFSSLLRALGLANTRSKEDAEMVSKVLMAIESGDVDLARELLSQRPDLIDVKDRRGWLHTAVSIGNEPMATMLLEIGCDINCFDMFGKHKITPVRTAVTKDRPEMLKFLLERGATPPPSDELLSAIIGRKEKSLELIKILQDHGANIHEVFINETTGEPENALSRAIEYEREDVVDYLRSKGCVLPSEDPTAPPAVETDYQEQDADIIAWFANEYGTVQKISLLEIVPTLPAIAVHVIRPNPKSGCITLFTTGMSSEALKVPKGQQGSRYSELFIQLPANWKVREIENPTYGWPIHWLRSLGKLPFQSKSYLAPPATIVSPEDAEETIAPNADFSALLLLPKGQMKSDDGRPIDLFQVFPLYPEEVQFEKDSGIVALLESIESSGVSLVVDLERKNTVQ